MPVAEVFEDLYVLAETGLTWAPSGRDLWTKSADAGVYVWRSSSVVIDLL